MLKITAFPRYSRCEVLGVASNPPKPDESLSGMRRREDEVMTLTNIKLRQSRTPTA